MNFGLLIKKCLLTNKKVYSLFFITSLSLLVTFVAEGTLYDDNTTNGWVIYDDVPEGASIKNEANFDVSSVGIDVISVQGSGMLNGYRLGNHAGSEGSWGNTTEKVISWDMKFSEDFNILVTIESTLGQRYLVYSPISDNAGIKGSEGNYIHQGLGLDAKNGLWQRVSRDLEADLQKFEPGNHIVSINGLFVRGSGLIDNIELSTIQYPPMWQSRVELRGENYAAGSEYHGGSFVERADGKILVTYNIGSKVMLSYVDTEAEFLSESNASAKNEWKFYTFYSTGSEAHLQKLNNGRILLYIKESGVNHDNNKPFRLDVYESTNGLGTDFVLKSTVYLSGAWSQYTFGARAIGQAIEYNGTILLPLAVPVGTDYSMDSRLYCAISTDGGASWSFSQISGRSTYRLASRGFGIAGDRIFILDQSYYAGGSTYLYSHNVSQLLANVDPHCSSAGINCNSGEIGFDNNHVWDYADEYVKEATGDMVGSHIFWQPDGYTYLLKGYSLGVYQLYRHPSNVPIDLTGQTPYQTGLLGSGATWEGPLNDKAYGDDGNEFFSLTPSGHLAIYGTSSFGGGSISHLYVGRQENLDVLPPVTTLVSPKDGISDKTPTYTWNAVANSSWYYLWVNDSSGNKVKKWVTAMQAGCASGSGVCSITPATVLENGIGQWWVLTWNSSGSGSWSSANTFNLKGKPSATTLISPSGGITDNTPTYRWNAISDSSWYYLWVNDSMGNVIKQWYTASQVDCASGTGECFITPTTVLANGSAVWWVQTWNSSGPGSWSSPLNLIVN